MKKSFFEKIILYSLCSTFLSGVLCLWISAHRMHLPAFGTKAYFRALPLVLQHRDFFWIAILSGTLAFLVCGILFWLYSQQAPEFLGSHIRGSQSLTASKLKKTDSQSKRKTNHPGRSADSP